MFKLLFLLCRPSMEAQKVFPAKYPQELDSVKAKVSKVGRSVSEWGMGICGYALLLPPPLLRKWLYYNLVCIVHRLVSIDKEQFKKKKKWEGESLWKYRICRGISCPWVFFIPVETACILHHHFISHIASPSSSLCFLLTLMSLSALEFPDYSAKLSVTVVWLWKPFLPPRTTPIPCEHYDHTHYWIIIDLM